MSTEVELSESAERRLREMSDALENMDIHIADIRRATNDCGDCLKRIATALETIVQRGGESAP